MNEFIPAVIISNPIIIMTKTFQNKAKNLETISLKNFRTPYNFYYYNNYQNARPRYLLLIIKHGVSWAYLKNLSTKGQNPLSLKSQKMDDAFS